MKVDAGL